MSVSNVVRWACGALVVCLGMNSAGMDRERRQVTTENPVVKCPKLARVCYDKYDVESGFLPWKEDLFKFVSSDFQDRLHSTNEKEKQQAIDEINVWSWISCTTAMFGDTWGHNSSTRNEAKSALLDAKNLARQMEDSLLVNVFDTVISSCNADPKWGDE